MDLTVFSHILHFGVHKPGPGFNSMSPDKIGLYVVMPLEQDWMLRIVLFICFFGYVDIFNGCVVWWDILDDTSITAINMNKNINTVALSVIWWYCFCWVL